MKLTPIYIQLREASNTELERDIAQLSLSLSKTIKDELNDNTETNEALDPLGVLSIILASNTVLHLLSKWLVKIFNKYNFEQGAAAAGQIEKITHKIENGFKYPIKKVVSLFSKDKATIDKTADGLFAVFLLSLGVKCGAEAYQSLINSDIISSGVSSLKGALKGKDIHSIVKKIAQG